MNMTLIVRYAKKLNAALTIEECRDIVSGAIDNGSNEAVESMGGLSEYYDTVITVFVMSINRSLCFAKDIDKASSDFYDLVDQNSSKTEKIFREYVSNLAGRIDIVDSNIFCAYLEKLIKYIFQSYNNHFDSHGNIEQIEREFNLRDNMINLIKMNQNTDLNKFTNKYSIQIPYMYSFVNDCHNIVFHSDSIANVFYTEQIERSPVSDGTYTTNMPILLKEYLKIIRNRELYTIMNVTEELSSDDDINSVNFFKLLPYIEYSDEKDDLSHRYYNIITDDDYMKSDVTEDWYCSLPLIPAILRENIEMKKFTAFFLTVFNQDIKIKEEKKKADDAVEQKNNIMSEFAHTYGNMSAETLGIIADKLLKSEDAEIRKLGRQTMMECGIKQDLTSAIQMLNMKFNNNRQKLRDLVCSGIRFGVGNDRVSIENIVSDAIKRVMLRIFYDRFDEEKLTKGKRNVCRAFGIRSLDEAIDDFEEDILHNENSITEWLNQKGIQVKLTIKSNFDDLYFAKNSKSAFFFKDIVSETFFNMIKYAKLSEPLYMIFSSDENYYNITFKNVATKYADDYRGKGLESKQEIIRMLNEETTNSKMYADINWKRENEEFTVQVVFAKEFLERRA